jgi:recombination protein RecT
MPVRPTPLSTYLESHRDRIAAVADKIPVDKIIQLAAIAAYRTPALSACEPGSVLAAVVQAVGLGLDIHPSSGEAYLVPYGTVCNFQTGYQGLCRLARQAGTRYIQARVVRANDAFAWRYTPELEMIHEPSREANPGQVIGAYAVARTETGELIGEWMTLAELEKVRAASKMRNSGAWKDWTEEMYKKTVCRRLCKWLPKSPPLVEALDSIDDDYRPDDGPEGQPEVLPGPSKIERLTAIVAARAAEIKTNGHVEARAVAEVAKAEPAIVPRTGAELEGNIPPGSLSFFKGLGVAKGFPRKIGLWSETHVKLAWEAWCQEGRQSA